MAGPSTEFMRGLERDYESWSPMTSWRPMAGRAPAASGSTQESVIEAAIPQDQRGCETTSNWWPSPVIASLMAMNGGGSAFADGDRARTRVGVRLKPPRRLRGLAHLTCALVPARCLKLIDNAQRALMRDILDIRDAVLVRSTVPWVTFVWPCERAFFSRLKPISPMQSG